MKSKKQKPIQRNPVAEAAYFRSGAGVHDKPHKSKRASAKMKLRKGNYDE